MDALIELITNLNRILWHEFVLYVILGVGVLFTLWSRFSQYRALTHGVDVIRGKFDDKRDPGAINHFQALSTALSATVGLGNIAGVALAVSVGGPGAVFWMWITGVVGMALKSTEVTQALLYRDTSDPDKPHGGAMYVAKQGFARISPMLAPLGTIVGGIFCVTLLISAVTGGNMFQAWNVADITWSYFGVNRLMTGIILTVLVGLVIIGGIKRIGNVTGRLVPIMCLVYLLAALGVIVAEYDRIPAMFLLIFTEAFSPTEAQGAFIGGAVGWSFLKGMQRSLFSSEAGQGSAPIAHSAAKTDEPVREGVVAGLEPFIDTLCVCTITAMVILLSGQWNREPDLVFTEPPTVVAVEGTENLWTLTPTTAVGEAHNIVEGQAVYAVVAGDLNKERGSRHAQLSGTLQRISGDADRSEFRIAWGSHASEIPPELTSPGAYYSFKGATLTAKAFDRSLDGLGKWLVPLVAWMFAISTIISWSYYGEQGMVYLLGIRSVMPYRIVYCLLIFVACTPLIASEAALDEISAMGTGVMLFANIPIMLIFGRQAMRAWKDYMRRLDSGEMTGHDAPPLEDVVEGRDVR